MVKTSVKTNTTPLQAAQLLLSSRKPYDALKIVNRVLKEKPKNWSAHVRRGKIMEWLGEFAKAHDAFDHAGANGASAELVRESKQRIETVKDLIDKAKVSLKTGDAEQALKDLEAAQSLHSSSMVELHMARALLALGKTETAKELIEAFLAERPGHSLANRLKEEAAKTAGTAAPEGVKTSKPRTAKKAAVPAQRKSKTRSKLQTLVTRDPAAEFDISLADRIEKIEAALPDDIAAARKHMRWLKRNADKIESRNWADDPIYAKAAHFLFAKNSRTAIENFHPHLITKSVEYGYVTWPRRIQKYIRHGRVLDIGCGFGAFGNGFFVAGASEYVGIDPQMPLESTAVKNKRKRVKADIGMTPREIMRKCPNIRLINGLFEDLDTSEKFDAVALHNVTEHLAQIKEIIPNIRRLLKPDGFLIYHHHNFYCWNGHHLAPNRPENYEPGVAAQDKMADWNHILIAPDMPDDHYFNTNLNQIRLDEIKAVTERNYKMEVWNEIDSSPLVAERLTDTVFGKLRDFDPTLSKRDLMVNAVLCVATPK